MKSLRTGFGLGLLAGGAAAADQLVEEWRASGGSVERAGILERSTRERRATPGGRATPDGADGQGSRRARRAARRAAAERPPWVVAPSSGPTGRAPARYPVPAPLRLRATVVERNPLSPKSVGISVGKMAARQAGKVVGRVVLDRMNRAIEMVEILEKAVAAAGEAQANKAAENGAEMHPPITPAPKPPVARVDGLDRPQANLVSVRNRGPGPRVVTGSSVDPAQAKGDSTEAEARTSSAASTAADAADDTGSSPAPPEEPPTETAVGSGST